VVGDISGLMVIDHIGIVVASLDEAAKYYVTQFGLRESGGRIHDPLQDVELQFLEDEGGRRLELIRPLSAASPASGALKQGGGLNHICYAVGDLDASIQNLIANDAKLVRPPTPAVAFDGRRVAFLYTRQRELVEFVETERR
jgi:methylmalonyl-CoA/ethylmalonyl-CoA epimerase